MCVVIVCVCVRRVANERGPSARRRASQRIVSHLCLGLIPFISTLVDN